MLETIPAALAGERVDRVVSMLTGLPRAEVAALVSAGAVRVGGGTVGKASRRLAEGEVVEVDLPVPSGGAVLAPDPDVAFRVVHADDDVIVVDKPAGVVVHPGAGHDRGTLVQGLLARFPELADLPAAGAGEGDRPGIVHRLDAGTSGLLVVARSPRAYRALVDQLGGRTVERRYRALVLGTVGADRGVVDAPVGRSDSDPTRMTVAAAGREARTRYEVVRRFREPVPTTELACRLETGRTHQIRVHLAAIGHPVVGDVRYGGARPALAMGRPFLHAGRLAFTHPGTGERVAFDSPLPDDLGALLESLS
ncbi:MAG TPA: RluA family pseudouridine synthase [Acidimicrobiales bacterium]|nr:RluA family pseudouridine synthase [Acidimicrobiales bacterium]